MRLWSIIESGHFVQIILLFWIQFETGIISSTLDRQFFYSTSLEKKGELYQQSVLKGEKTSMEIPVVSKDEN